MDVKEGGERLVIAKPVPSRPSCSTFRSFSELLAGAINGSPPNSCSETAVAAIRPKTVRVKPVAIRPSSIQVETPGTSACTSSDKVLKSEVKSTVLYRPTAKLVSKSTASLLSNLGNFNVSHQQVLAQVEGRVQHPNQEKHQPRSHVTSNTRQNPPPPLPMETDQAIESSKTAPRNVEEDQKPLPPTSSTDRPSYDGYNWRKYGQKQVKGSEYPRSYYKCTHPNCPVKKKVERSFDGQIAEIVYKGEHNHSKPQPPKRNSSGTNGPGGSDGPGQDTNNPLSSNDGFEARIGNQNETGLSTRMSFSGKAPLIYDPVVFNAANRTPDNSCGLSGDCDDLSKGIEAGDDEPRSKRRKNESRSNGAGASGDVIQEPHVAAQTANDPEILGDGFRWRKYGQKVVKGNSYPRSYYRCTSLKCNVRKHVERASDDPRSFITTYEGKHNHDMPSKNANSTPSEPDSKPLSSKDKF